MEQSTRAALDKLYHRGPDGEGIYRAAVEGGALTLAHRRLAIIDLSDSGLQPMKSDDERYVITYNGEIYNYVELRKELEGMGHSFRTQTDTEVLLVAWRFWGQKALDKLDGMFAFAVFDKLENTLTCVRDPFGIKPFYYCKEGESFVFGSEIPALLELLDHPVELNPQRAHSYLCWYEYDDGDDTFYQGVHQLKPGHLLTVHLGEQARTDVERWWWPSIEERSDLTLDSAAEELRSLFLSSVRRQLRSDVPLGAALSGGVDSSAIVCAMRHLEPDMPIHTFSYIATGSAMSEEHWCRIVEKHTGSIPHWTSNGIAEISSDLDEIIRAQGEPFGSTGVASQYSVFALAKESGITVTLDGQGADELLAGYDGYPTALFQSFIERGEYVKLKKFISAWRKWPGRSQRTAMLHLGDAAVPSALRALALRLIGYDLNPTWLDEEKIRAMGAKPVPPMEFPTSEEGRNRRLAEHQRSALLVSRLPALLRHGDRSSMRWSIESRVPFLTAPLADFMLSLPERYLVSSEGETKHVFRRAMRGIVPDEILDRRDKIGFDTPEKEILNKQRERIFSWIDAGAEVSFIKPEEVRKEVGSILDGTKPFSNRAWRMINYCRWASLQPSKVLLS